MASRKVSANSSANYGDEEMDSEFVPGYNDMAAFSQASFKSIMGAIKSSNELPSSGDDFDYYSSFDAFRNLMDMEGTRMVHLIQKIMRYHGIRGNLATNSELRETEDKYDVLVDANDQLLERVGTFLDEAQGLRKQENPLVVASVSQKKNISGSWNKKTPSGRSRTSSNYRLLAAKNIQRPQTRFKDKIDNSTRPFVPKIQHKPHALKPLSESLVITESSMDSDSTEENLQFPHPYQYELDHFTPLPRQLGKGQIQDPLLMDDCPLALIDTVQELDALVNSLKSEKEIAVDLEHHSYRSFQGITCLMQLSTRTHDYLIDTIELRSDLHVLNEIFTNPKIVKVFHGADLDIDWLQRDLGLYVVNMFDTGQAARVLNLQRFALSYLLLTYCQVEADKQFQLADWRIRPLPEELVKYAREDTHYLLYVYDRLRTELIERGNDQNNLLLSVIQRSKQICEKRYVKPKKSAEQYLELYKRSKKVFNSQQLAALKGLHTWRDALARLEDESIGYILPNHMLLQISEVLPREHQGILACCNPIPPLVRQNLNEMHNIVKQSRETPLIKPEPSKVSLKPTKTQNSVNSLLTCPHDLSHQKQPKPSEVQLDKDAVPVAEFSTLFKDMADIHVHGSDIKPSSLLQTLSRKPLAHKELTDAQTKSARIWAQFINPIEKFLPSPILEKGEHGGSGPTQVDEKWTLLPHTERPTVPKEKPKIQVTQAAVAKEDMIAVDDVEPDKDDNPLVSLRQQFPKGKKQQSDAPAADVQTESRKLKDGSSEWPKLNESSVKKQSKSVFMKPEEDFQAYDYSKTDYNKMFTGGGGKKKDYNPDGESYDGKHKGSKGKAYAGGSKKSMTYNKGKGGTASKIQWPKR